jgi:hypothetical protein
MKKRKIALVVAAIVVLLLVFGGKWLRDNFTVQLPTYPPAKNVVWLDQHWTAAQRDWFHHADQGTQTFGIPYEWFVALEQPALSFGTPGLLSDSSYLDRYGFIPSGTNSGDPELPVGFAHGGPLREANGPVQNPQTKKDMTGLGLTCAACHTGRFTYQNTTVLVDGAPALTNLTKFEKGVALSLLYTRYVPFRFDRFADRVLGPGASDEAKAALRKQLEPVVSSVLMISKLEKNVAAQTVEEGFARLDALNRIGNIVFALDLSQPANFVGYSAPVHFPRIWNAPWFGWVQYNGSIQQPMTRNAGEALGVGAKLNLTGGDDPLFSSSVLVKPLFELEQQIAGTPPPNAASGFNGLASPRWQDANLAKILPPIDTKLIDKGAGLYKKHCRPCHMAPVSDPEFWSSNRWSAPNAAGERFLDLEMIDIKHVGTDPAQASDMKNRKVVTPSSLRIPSDEFGGALRAVVEGTVNRWYDSQVPPTPADERDQMNGRRPDGVRAELAYKVRPLNGIWATPPYLHNGSVPNLYALLSPVAERPTKFYLGNREYDAVNVGYRIDAFSGGFEFDTTKRGNANTGHEFNDSPNKDGVIGPFLSPDERRELIEYLKTL